MKNTKKYNVRSIALIAVLGAAFAGETAGLIAELVKRKKKPVPDGGDPDGDGTGGPGYCIKGEFKLNGVKNNLSHKRGVLSMARAQAANSAGSQFFIMHEDGEFLDGQYAAFGKVLEGMDVVDKIAAVKTDGNDRPLTEQKIASIRVDTKGEEYPEPDKLRDPYGRG